MWWGKGPDKPAESPTPSPAESKDSKPVPKEAETPVAEFDPKKLPVREKLPEKLQKIVDKADKEDNLFDELVEGYAPPSTESNIRYAAYTARFRTILLSAHRYVAYTSDIGESFRPVAHPNLVRAAYGVSWAYILGDVGYEGYKAYWHNQRIRNPQLELTEKQLKLIGPSSLGSEAVSLGVVPPLEDYRTVMIQRGLFQSIASMGLPAFTIHSVVRYSGRAMKDIRNKTIRTWGPIGLGLAVVPFLPALFDKPVENAVEYVFHKGFETFGGKQAVGDSPAIGRENLLSSKPAKPKEKEL